MLRKIVRPINIIVLSLVIGLVGFVNYVVAETKTAGPLDVSYDGAGSLFAGENIGPGDSVTKQITVTNNGNINHSFAIATGNVEGDLADKLSLSPIVDGNVIWTKTLTELANLPEESATVLNDITSGEQKNIDIKVDFSADAGNEYQNKLTRFDLVFGSQEPEPLDNSASGAFSTALTSETSQTTTEAAQEPEDKNEKQDGDSEVKGAQTQGNGLGENVWLLLIVPVAAVGALAAMPTSLIRNVGLPLFFGSVAVVLTNFIKGGLDPNVFWTFLGGEILIAGGVKMIIADKHKDWYRSKRKTASWKNK